MQSKGETFFTSPFVNDCSNTGPRVYTYVCVCVCVYAQIRSKSMQINSVEEKSTPMNLLISYQGSGNHWVRQLIEQGAGLMTGSLYPGDFAHWRNIGINLDNKTVTKSIRKGHTVIVKSHSPLGIRGMLVWIIQIYIYVYVCLRALCLG